MGLVSILCDVVSGCKKIVNIFNSSNSAAIHTDKVERNKQKNSKRVESGNADEINEVFN